MAPESFSLKQTVLSRIVAHFAAGPEQVRQQFDAVYGRLITPDTEAHFRALLRERIAKAEQLSERVQRLVRESPVEDTTHIQFASLVRYRQHGTNEERQGIYLRFCPDNFPFPLEEVGYDLLPEEFRHQRAGDTVTVRLPGIGEQEETYTILHVD